MKDYAFLILLLVTIGTGIWFDNHPINCPDLTPHIDRVMEAIAPSH